MNAAAPIRRLSVLSGMERTKASPVESLLGLDRAARKLFKPYSDTAAVAAIHWAGQAGDQLQLRMLTGGVFALGLLRRDPRLIGAALRMLVAHEIATLAKTVVKNQVDRWRPGEASSGEDIEPRAGHSEAKALSSFPSGHSAGAMAVACAFASEYPEHRIAALCLGGAVSGAQIPTCAHYPSDVVTGAALGAATNAGVGIIRRAAVGVWRLYRR